MANYNLPVLATVILLLPMLYFGIASLTFFLRTFDDPIVTRLLRALFGTCFLAVAVCCALGGAVFAAYRHPLAGAGLGLVAICAGVARRAFLSRMDTQMRARDAGDAKATRRLRRLHVAGIAYNTIQIVAVFGMLPPLVPAGV